MSFKLYIEPIVGAMVGFEFVDFNDLDEELKNVEGGFFVLDLFMVRLLFEYVKEKV